MSYEGGVLHIGRSWSGGEEHWECGCRLAPCGLVDGAGIDPECAQHGRKACKTMRQIHADKNCPATPQNGEGE